ncbi:PQQ-binding-like beta-propeller repeat protein, partial [Candidatus Poribacteria bacterium]
DGSILWQKTVREELPHEGTHAEGSWASGSPVTDGEHVYAFFGSRGLYCFDMQGNLIWEKDLGDMKIKMSFGEGSSPVLHGDILVVNWDHEGQSFIVALDKKTGEELWKVDRDEKTSWATPLVVEHNGRSQVITSATKLIRSYDLATGELIWEVGGMTANVIPNPVYANGVVYIMSGFRGNALLAINLDLASGDITDSEAIVWRYDEKETPYTPSPLLYGDTLYFLRLNNGFLSCFNVATGQAHYTGQKLEGIKQTFVSPVGASERVYITGQDGVTVVIERGSEFKILATNSLDDNFTASPAIVDREIYLRGHKHLYRISSD